MRNEDWEDDEQWNEQVLGVLKTGAATLAAFLTVGVIGLGVCAVFSLEIPQPVVAQASK